MPDNASGAWDLIVAPLDSTEMPGLRYPAGRGPALGDVENCLAAITDAADVVAATLACTWLPEQVSSPPARDAIVRLAGARHTAHLAARRHAGRQHRLTP